MHKGKNPATDFRAMGLLGLKHLLYITKKYPDFFQKVLAQQNQKKMADQYPACAAGINLSQLLLKSFRIGEEGNGIESSRYSYEIQVLLMKLLKRLFFQFYFTSMVMKRSIACVSVCSTKHGMK